MKRIILLILLVFLTSCQPNIQTDRNEQVIQRDTPVLTYPQNTTKPVVEPVEVYKPKDPFILGDKVPAPMGCVSGVDC